jgi:probable F420-dependent oxidoreductase
MEFDIYSFGMPLHEVGPTAAEAERQGFSGMWFTESAHNPFLPCAVAAVDTERLVLGTGIAVAFPRSPMVTAQVSWDLAAAAPGRFVLGLGTQVKPHIERRFSVPFDRPVARLREYILSLRAIWRAFQGEEPLRFEGEFYRFSLLTDYFSAGPIANPSIPIYVAGVNERLAHLTGELCDGFHVHPLHSRSYLEQRVFPSIEAGARAAGREFQAVTIACPVFMIVGETEEEIESQRKAVRRQLAFYGSTKTYESVFIHHGWDDTGARLRRLLAANDIAGMEAEITDEMLDVFAITAGWDDLPKAIADRYTGIADRVFPYSGLAEWKDPAVRERWGDVAKRVQSC